VSDERACSPWKRYFSDGTNRLPERGIEKPNTLERALWWMSGTDPSIAIKCPNANRQLRARLGSTALSIALIAAALGYNAISVNLDSMTNSSAVVSAFTSVIGGSVIAFVVLHINRRMLTRGGKASVLQALAFALVLAFGSSVPLTTQVLKNEIESIQSASDTNEHEVGHGSVLERWTIAWQRQPGTCAMILGLLVSILSSPAVFRLLTPSVVYDELVEMQRAVARARRGTLLSDAASGDSPEFAADFAFNDVRRIVEHQKRLHAIAQRFNQPARRRS